MRRVTKNLSIDADALEHAERYSKRYSTSLSRLVSDYFAQLRVDDDAQELSPTVRRLLGAAAGQTDERDYYAYLDEKYGR
ncbi:MAG TPA: DUF6364 family protein [Longimicrobiaceae bacterium]|jgi:hypothetical protein|nr:DUF6364 family protein [Longimicrobiaceae bacterium]